MFTGFPTD